MQNKTVSLPPVRVEPKLLDRLQEIADRSPASMSAHVRQAVIEYVERLQPTTSPVPLPETGGNGAATGSGDD